jgi:four helix bundle protein
MKSNNVVREKSYDFALEIIKVVRYLQESKKEFVISTQLLKSGTSIGANIEESLGAQSRKDFLHKISIAYKEARETQYWLRLLKDSNLLDNAVSDKLILNIVELLKIIGSIQKTVKNP